MTPGLSALRSTGATLGLPSYLLHLARAYAELGKFDEAWRCISDATAVMKLTTKDGGEAEANRIAGEIALMSPKPDAAKAEAYFERALAVARNSRLSHGNYARRRA